MSIHSDDIYPLSQLAETLIPSEIIKLGNEINQRIQAGKKIYNFTIGDFDPTIFPIPEELEKEIIDAYLNKKTNYPPANGILPLRQAVSDFISSHLKISYHPNNFLISGGGRPLIYATYRVLCDKNDKVIYPVPSWNNNHYTHFVEGEHVCVQTSAENNFLPTAEELIPHLKNATLLALCSPLNPTGTVFGELQLKKICEAVYKENQSRDKHQKPLFILYDQIYWTMTYGDTKHFNPVAIMPEMRDYTIFIGGISKAFCATGVRVGWAFGPERIISKMRGVLSHIGAWSPMAEQVATAKFLQNKVAVDEFLIHNKIAIHERLIRIYNGLIILQKNGYPVEVIAPMAAMYLTLKIKLIGKTLSSGKTIESINDASEYLLENAFLAIVPFSAFGADGSTEWYRLSVGTCKLEEIDEMLDKLKTSLEEFKNKE
jgi:aspartate aminotransferase